MFCSRGILELIARRLRKGRTRTSGIVSSIASTAWVIVRSLWVEVEDRMPSASSCLLGPFRIFGLREMAFAK